MLLADVFSPKNIIKDMESDDKEESFEELVNVVVSNGCSLSREVILSALFEREGKLSTGGIKRGVALPHARFSDLKGSVGVLGISHKGIEYDSLDGSLVHIIFMLLSDGDNCSMHLRIIQRLACLLENSDFLESLFKNKDSESIYDTLCTFERRFLGDL